MWLVTADLTSQSLADAFGVAHPLYLEFEQFGAAQKVVGVGFLNHLNAHSLDY